MMKKLLMILIFAFLAFGFAKADSYTNVYLVTYNADTGKICVPSKTNECCEITWNQLVGEKSNWGYVRGDGDQSCNTNVTFATPFCSVPDITINLIGVKLNTAPTSRTDLAASVVAGAFVTAQIPKTNQFTAVVSSLQNITTNTFVAFSWNAKLQGDD